MSASELTFPLNPKFGQGVVTVVLPTPDTLDASAGFSISAAKPISVGPAHVSFSADANAAIGIFTTPGTLRAALLTNEDLVSQVGDSLTFSSAPDSRFLMLRWGYDLSATASGTVALAPAAGFALSAQAGRKGYYAVVQAAAPGANVLEAIGRLIATWQLPSQVRDIDQLPPATWLISEVDGSFSLKADLKFGFNFSWLREAAGALKGDIGLKLQTGLSATLGFSTSGKYAIALSRETADPKIRLRLFKLRVNNWNFGFSGSAIATPQAPLPDKFDDLVSAVVGTHHRQILKLLGQVEDWTDPAKPIFGPFVNLADAEARRLLQDLNGVPDLVSRFTQVKDRIRQLFQFWDNLPEAATRLIASKLPDSSAISQIASLAKQVAALTPAGLETLLHSTLGDSAFLSSTQGQALEALAANGIFSALNNAGALAAIQQAARNVVGLLDGSKLQALLTNLQQAIETRLDIKQIESASLDPWLKARLESFLDQKLDGPVGLAALEKLRAGLAALRAQKDELYAKALEALRRNYEFSFNAAYQNTATTSALLDATFDFGAPATRAAQGLSLALDGKFDDLLAQPLSGVHIEQGVLAYGIHKESHVSLTLPYFSTNETHINDALAQLTHVNEDGGGLIYSLEAKDLVTVKNNYSSALAITLSVPGGLPAVELHSSESASYRYDLEVSSPQLTAADLETRFAPYIHAYFPTEFTPQSPGTFEGWVRTIAGPGGQFGNSSVALNVSLPPAALLAWLNAPASSADPIYRQMSLNLQRRFKQLLHDYFFSDIRNYRNVSGDTAAKAVLVFCSVPPVNAGGDLYWDYRDRDLRSQTLFAPAAVANLRSLLQTARLRIQAAGDPDHKLAFYDDSQAAHILNAALHGQLLDFLFPVEANMVEEARQAGLKMAQFRADRFANPQQARRDLARFGQKLTEDFNHNLKTFAVGNALLPLGTLVYAEAVAALDPRAAAPAAAMFSVRAQNDPARTERVVHVAEVK